jgi:putative methanogenesis marker protein 8
MDGTGDGSKVPLPANRDSTEFATGARGNAAMTDARSGDCSPIDRLIEKHRHREDLHITRALGAIVVVSDGKVIDVDTSGALRSCPMQRWFGSAEPASYVQQKIDEFGHFRCCRQAQRDDIAVPYGTSEMFMTALKRGLIDCAVTVSDGAGSVVSDNPSVVQGIGARMNGVFYTTPIGEVLNRYRDLGCTVFDDGRIDQLRAVRAAASAGHRRIAVTVNAFYGESYRAVRRLEKDLGLDIFVAAVCSTGVSRERARELTEHSDIGWSCASRHVRDLGRAAILQLTCGIPVFVYSRKGVELIAAYSDESGAMLLKNLGPGEQHILASDVPGQRVAMGNGILYLAPASLPVIKHGQPEPLR